MTTDSTQSTLEYIRTLDLPEAGALETGGAAAAPLRFSQQPHAVTVGSQMTEFTSAVPPPVRGAIANCILLAQLAAQKAALAQDVFRWYEKYTEVLRKIGWQTRALDFQTYQVSDRDADLHEAIIPVITAMLGPQAAAASIVVSVLESLQKMKSDAPWIRVFERVSRNARGAKLQVGVVDANAEGAPEISLLCLGVEAERTVTQVLFFKFAGEKAELKKASGKVTVSLERLRSVEDLVRGRVQAFVSDYISEIEI